MKAINIIVASGRNGAIGLDGGLPWELPGEWRYFLNTVRGGILLGGRACIEGLREHTQETVSVGLTRDRERPFADAFTAHSLAGGIALAESLEHPGPVWLVGGERVYGEVLPLADRLYITEIDADFEADTWMPPWQHIFSREITRRETEEGGYRLAYRVLAKD